MTTRSIARLCALALLIPGLACSSQDMQSPPRSEIPPMLDALPDVVLGADLDAPPELQFHDVLDVVALANGSIWVIDGDDSRLIRRYGGDGAYLGVVSGSGDGPGEHRSPFRLAELPDGRVAVLDLARAGRVSLFDEVGSWLEDISLPGRPVWDGSGSLVADSAGWLWLPIRTGPADAPAWLRFHPGLEHLGADTVPVPPLDHLEPESGIDHDGLRAPYTPDMDVALGPNGDLWAAWTGAYRVHRLDPARPDSTVVVVDLPADALQIPDEERRDIRRALEAIVADFHGEGTPVPSVPTSKPILREILVTPGGYLITRPHAPSELEGDDWSEPTVIDIWDVSGAVRRIGRLRPSGEHEVLAARDRMVWTLHRDPSGLESIRGFRIDGGGARSP